MAFTQANSRNAAMPFASLAAFFSTCIERAERFAAEAEQEKKLNLLNSVSDKTLSRMGLSREDLRAHVLGH